MRVATRRLRAVLELYAPCFPARELRPVLRDVRRLADALGARRDPDVQLARVAAFARGAGEPSRPGSRSSPTRSAPASPRATSSSRRRWRRSRRPTSAAGSRARRPAAERVQAA